MAKYAGLTTTDILSKIRSDAQAQVRSAYEKFNADVDEITKLKFSDYVESADNLLYHAWKGLSMSFYDTCNAFNVIGTNYVNGIKQSINEIKVGNYGQAARDIAYTNLNPIITFMEDTANVIVSAGNRITGEGSDQLQQSEQTISDIANAARRIILKDSSNFGVNTIFRSGENEQIVEDFTLPETDDWLDKTSGPWRDWWEEQTTTFFGLLPDLPEWSEEIDAKNNNKIYQELTGISESIGQILAYIAIGKITNALGGDKKLVKRTAELFFASEIFGNSYQQAINNGSSSQDAYNYAFGIMMVEMATENMGGLVPGGEQGVSIWERLIPGTVGRLVEEGMEEIYADFGESGLSIYSNGDHKVDNISESEFLGQLVYSFAGGALAAATIGGGQALVFNTTVDSKVSNLYNTEKKAVAKYGEERATKIVNKQVQRIVNALNSKTALGYVEKKGGPTLRVLSLEEKQNFVKKYGLSSVVSEKGGTFSITDRVKQIIENGGNIFRNTLNGKQLTGNDYAINEEVRGVDISDSGRVEVLKNTELNEVGKNVLSKLSIPAAIFQSDGLTDAFYGENGVLYLNQSKLTNENMVKTIVTHEVMHAIAEMYPETYMKLEDSISKFVSLDLDKNGVISVKYNNKAVGEYLEESGFSKAIFRSFNNYFSKTHNADKALDMTHEEVSAYFAENVFKGGRFMNIVSKEKPRIFKQISDRLQQNKEIDAIAQGDKTASKTLKRIRNRFETAVKNLVVYRKTIGCAIKYVFGTNFDWSTMFTKEAIDKYGLENLRDALWDVDPNNIDSIVVNGNRLFLEDILTDVSTWGEFRPQRLEEPDLEKIRKEFTFDEEQISHYRRILKKYINANQDFFEIDDVKERRIMRSKLSAAEDMLENFDSGKKTVASVEQMDVLREIYAANKFEELEASWRKLSGESKSENIYLATFRAVQKVIKFFRTKTGFQGWQNLARSREFLGQAKLRAEIKDQANADAEAKAFTNVISRLLEIYYPGQFNVSYMLYPNNTVGYSVIPTKEYIDEQANIIEEERKQKQDEAFEFSGVEEIEDTDDFKKIQTDFSGLLDDIKKVLRQTNALPDVDFDNITIEIPSFNKGDDVNAINNALYDNKIAAVIVPITWNGSYNLQRQIDSDAKLVYSNPIGKASIEINRGAQPVKLVEQIWVSSEIHIPEVDGINFDNNLRLNTWKPIHSPDFSTRLINNAEKYKFAKNVDFDFAVYYSGNGLDFNKKFTSYEELDSKHSYILIKAKNAAALKILQSIDFSKLSQTGGVIRDGYNIYDLVEAYNMVKFGNDYVVKERQSTEELTDEEKKQIAEVTNNPEFSRYFVMEDGKLVVKNKLLMPNYFKSNYGVYKGKEYSADEYALNMPHGGVIQLDADTIPVKRGSFSILQRTLYDLAKSMNINFVMYNKMTPEAGMSKYEYKNNAIFINIYHFSTELKEYNDQGYSLLGGVSTIVHEATHEMFKFNPQDVAEFAPYLSTILFNVNKQTKQIEVTELYKEIDKKYDLINRFRYVYGFSLIDSPESIYNVLNRTALYLPLARKNKFHGRQILDTRLYPIANEVIAHLCGYIFSSPEAINKIYGSKYALENTWLNKIYRTAASSASNKNVFDFVLAKYSETYQKYLESMKALFHKKSKIERKFALADVNKFLKEFTDGEYTSRGDLLNDYFEEQKNHKRGKATNTIDNIIYIAGELERAFGDANEAYKDTLDEFQAYKDGMETVINDETMIFHLAKKNNKLIAQYNSMRSAFNEVKRADNNQTVAEQSEIIGELAIDFIEEYKNFTNEFLDVIGLPSIEEVEEAVYSLYDVTEEISKKYKAGEEVSAVDFKGLATDFLTLARTVNDFINGKKVANVTMKTLMNTKFEARDYKMKNLANGIKSRVDAAKKRLLSYPRQKESQLTDILSRLIDLSENMADAVNKNSNDLNAMKKEMISIADEIGKAIIATEVIDISEKEEIRTVELKRVFMQIANIFDSISELDERYPEEERKVIVPIKKRVIYTDTALGSALKDIIMHFETQYTTVYRDGVPLVDYSDMIIKQVADNLSSENPLDTKHLIHSGMMMTHQDFFMQWARLTQGKVDFFTDFWREYRKAVNRRARIIHRYLETYKSYIKENPDIRKHSAQNVEISPDYLINMSSTDFNTLQEKIIEKLDELKKERAKLLKERQELKDKKQVYVAEKAVQLKILKDIKNGIYGTTQKRYAQGEVDKYNALIKPINKRLNEISRALYQNSQEKQSNNAVDQIKLKLHDYVDTHKEAKLMNHGQIVNMYMGVLREIEMEVLAKKGVDGIVPTNHYRFGGEVRLFDNEREMKYGYESAKRHVEPFVIYANNKIELANYLESLLDEEDWNTIDFIKLCFEKNYELIDEIYLAKYQVHLARQAWYVPFSSVDSDYARDFKLKLVNRTNLGVARGMVLETKLGSTTPLKIENIFDVLENYVLVTANYSLDRLISDYQNLLVNRGHGLNTFQEQLTNSKSPFGIDNGFIEHTENAFKEILRYGDQTLSQINKVFNKVLHNLVGAKVALADSMMVKQFVSIVTISLKNNLNPLTLAVNVMKSMGRSKYRRWLYDNNDNFYFRAQVGNIPNQAEEITPTLYYSTRSAIRKVLNALGWHVGWADNTVLVGAFKTIADDIRKKNPKMTEDEVLNAANEKFEEVLLYGVANTDPAYRSSLSNSGKWWVRMFMKFQSENSMQTSAIIRDYYLAKNKVIGSTKIYLRDIFAYLASALWAAIISTLYGYGRGNIEKEDVPYEFALNYFLLDNLIGTIPLINQITSILQFEKGKGLTSGFVPQVPGLYELYKAMEAIGQIGTSSNPWKKTLTAAEYLGSIGGIPIQNADRIIQLVSRLIGNGTADAPAMAITRFYSSQTKAEAFYDAIKENNKTVMNAYVEEIFDNNIVKKEMLRLLSDNPDAKIKIYNVDSFRKKNDDGTYSTYALSSRMKEKYNEYAQQALLQLIRSTDYIKLSDDEKIKAIQRVINYYYNYMKTIVLDEAGDMLPASDVVARSLSYAE